MNEMISALFGAWILSWFGLDEAFIEVVQPIAKVTITTSHYYFTFAIIGLFCGLFGK